MTAYMFKDPRCAFVRVPKTGSTSILRAFFEVKSVAKSDGPLPGKEFWSYDKSFAFVRNPLDRFKSVLSMFRLRGRNINGEYNVPNGWKYPTVEQILSLVDDDKYKLSKANYLENMKIHAIPMVHDYFALTRVDRIFRYENMNEEWDNLAAYLCMSAPNIVVYNASIIPVELNEHEEKMVKTFYKADYKVFKYKMK